MVLKCFKNNAVLCLFLPHISCRILKWEKIWAQDGLVEMRETPIFSLLLGSGPSFTFKAWSFHKCIGKLIESIKELGG